jgi:hypothetical protein
MSNKLYGARAPNIVIVFVHFVLILPVSISIWICNPVRIYGNKRYDDDDDDTVHRDLFIMNNFIKIKNGNDI